MAVTPLLVLDLPTLKGKLRLGNLLAQDAASPILDSAMQFARLTILDALQESGAAYLVGIPRTENPVSKAQVQRVKAEHLEVTLVMMYLVQHLPTAFMDAGGAMLSWYNTEAPFRLKGPDQRAEYKKELEAIASQYLQSLSTEIRGTGNSCDAAAGMAPCAHVVSALGETQQAPLLEAISDPSYLGINRESLKGFSSFIL